MVFIVGIGCFPEPTGLTGDCTIFDEKTRHCRVIAILPRFACSLMTISCRFFASKISLCFRTLIISVTFPALVSSANHSFV